MIMYQGTTRAEREFVPVGIQIHRLEQYPKIINVCSKLDDLRPRRAASKFQTFLVRKVDYPFFAYIYMYRRE